jgi:hypothetical protein
MLQRAVMKQYQEALKWLVYMSIRFSRLGRLLATCSISVRYFMKAHGFIMEWLHPLRYIPFSINWNISSLYSPIKSFDCGEQCFRWYNKGSQLILLVHNLSEQSKAAIEEQFWAFLRAGARKLNAKRIVQTLKKK